MKTHLIPKSVRSWLKTSLWVLPGAILFFGYLVIDWPYLRQHLNYPDWFLNQCTWSWCPKQQQQDLSKLQTLKAVLRPEPEQSKQLRLDAIIENTASFQQPAPVLVLSFYDLNGQEIHQQYIRPQTYQQGQLQGEDLLPAASKIHVSVVIPSPAFDFENYQLSFIP